MGDGDFWHIFIQRANKLIKTPLNQTNEDVLNSLLFKETLTFCNTSKYKPGLLDRYRLCVLSNGFTFNSFKDIARLMLSGSVNKTHPYAKVNKYHLSLYASQYSSEAKSASVWMGEKVEVEQGFIVNFNFMFDTNVEVNPTKHSTNTKLSSSFCFIIQARDSVDSLQNSAPMNAGSIKKGIAINFPFTTRYNMTPNSKVLWGFGMWMKPKRRISRTK